MEHLRAAIYEVVEADMPMTVRQVFYRMVSAGVIAKSEAEYKQTIVRLLLDMRLAGELPFDWIADNTRWMRKPTTHSSLEAALRRTAETYRRALWDAQDAYVEIWLEKDALAGVLLQVTDPWDVPLMVTRGYASITYLHAAAETIQTQGKPAYIYYFGDHDPSGVDIPRQVEARLRQFAPAAEIHFERVAVQPWQIATWNLPTRPTKATDSRRASFGGDESVEVDAIPPQQLRELASARIVQHVDKAVLERTLTIETCERETLESVQASIVEAALDHEAAQRW